MRPKEVSRDASYRAAQARKAKLNAARGRAMIEAILSKAAERKYDLAEIFPLVFEAILSHSWHDVVQKVAARREVAGRSEDALRRLISGLPEKSRPGLMRELLLELVITRAVPGPYTDGPGPELRAAAKTYGIDLKKVSNRAAAKASPKKNGKKK